jgi:hypothetical protein
MKPVGLLTALLAGFLGSALFALLRQAPPFQQEPRVIEAEEFRLVDSQGTVRGWFRVRGGNAALCITDKDYKTGPPRALMGVDANGVPTLSISDATGPRVLLGIKDKGGAINLYNEAGRWSTLGPDVLNLRDTQSRVRLSIAVLTNETPAIAFYDERGHVQASTDLSPPGRR